VSCLHTERNVAPERDQKHKASSGVHFQQLSGHGVNVNGCDFERGQVKRIETGKMSHMGHFSRTSPRPDLFHTCRASNRTSTLLWQ
jgi:hypothetical protein